MITYAVNEDLDLLGFIPTWIRKLAERGDKLYVITLNYNDETILPQNVAIYGLNEKSNRFSKYLYFSRIMFKLLSKKEVDVIFCHMSPTFVIMVAPWAKFFRVPIVMWYTHGTVSWRLKLAHFLANKIVTASKESFRIASDKVIVIGHGIDTSRFKPAVNQKKGGNKKTILSVGRISPRKDYETLIKAADVLVNEKNIKDLEFIIVGGVPIASQEEYYEGLKKMVRELELEDYVKFTGSIPYNEILSYYQNCDLFVSTSQTGSLDKTVLEAMACEKPVIVCNEAFKEMLRPFDSLCLFKCSDYRDIAEKLKNILDNEHLWREIGMRNREEVINNHNISHLTDSLISIFKEVAGCA